MEAVRTALVKPNVIGRGTLNSKTWVSTKPRNDILFSVHLPRPYHIRTKVPLWFMGVPIGCVSIAYFY